MALPRNHIARLPWEIREAVCRLRFDGAGNAAIGAAVREACRAAGIAAPKIHGSSILAYASGGEFKEYCDRRRAWDAKMAPRRWAASLLHEGKGPQTVADLAELEILEQLHALAAGGLLETGKDVANVARAITSMQRTHLARRQEEADGRLEAIDAEHAAAVAALQADLAEARGEIERLRNGGKEVDAAAVAARMNEVLGVKK